MNKKITLLIISILIIFLITGCDTNQVSKPGYETQGYVKLPQDQSILISKNDWSGSPSIIIKYQTIKDINYSVKYGDSLYLIAKNYNSSIQLIKELNNLSTDDIYVGQELNISTPEVVYSYNNDSWIPIDLKKGITIKMKTNSSTDYYFVVTDTGKVVNNYLPLSYLIYKTDNSADQ